MKRKNPTVQSYIVRRKNDPIIKIDTEFFYGACFADDTSLIVTSDPYFKPWDSLRGGAWWFKAIDPQGVVSTHSAGDMGVPGYAYDERPNLFCTTKEEREIVAAKHNDWLEEWGSAAEYDAWHGYYD